MYPLRENISTFFNQLLNNNSQCLLCLNPPDNLRMICDACLAELPRNTHACSQCSEPLTESHGTNPRDLKIRCARCQQNPPAYDYSHCTFLYQPPVTHWIHCMKDQHQFHWYRHIAQLMIQKPPNSLAYVDALTYIPTTRWRLLQRGFNASELIARQLSTLTGLPLIHQGLQKTSGKDQRGLNRKQRQQNLKNSLQPGTLDLSGKHLLVVDDVMTTGATFHAAARALKQQRAKYVGGWAFARTPPSSSTTSHAEK